MTVMGQETSQTDLISNDFFWPSQGGCELGTPHWPSVSGHWEDQGSWCSLKTLGVWKGWGEDGISILLIPRTGLRSKIKVCFSRLFSLQPPSCNFQRWWWGGIQEVCDVLHFLNGTVKAKRYALYGDLREFLQKWRKNSKKKVKAKQKNKRLED